MKIRLVLLRIVSISIVFIKLSVAYNIPNQNTIEKTVQNIRININSTIANDIVKITHSERESKIIIHFKQLRRCQQPHLVGRLSGPALSRILWGEELQEKNNEALLEGYYHIPFPGKYFIEIIITMCNKIRIETNIKDICLEDPSNHRLTAKGSFIYTQVVDVHKDDLIGYWYNKNYKHDPLYTRYQPQHCRESTRYECIEATSVSRFNAYEFKFNVFGGIDLNKSLKEKKGTICFEGASHSRVLNDHVTSLLSQIESHNVSTLGRRRYDTRYASMLESREWIQNIINKNCSKIVFGVGQWDAGWPRHKPTSFSDYKNSLSKAMPLMVEMFRNSKIDFYFRTMHYNPIGDKIGACPPEDWRSPPVIDMYNRITKQLCKEFKISLIDTNDIVGVTWDRASDWCHYEDSSGEMEAIYILHRIFVSSTTRKIKTEFYY